MEDIGEVSIMEATKGIDFALQQINTKQKSWFYKMRLVLKRFYHQCIKSRNRKDFVKWFYDGLLLSKHENFLHREKFRNNMPRTVE